MQAKFEKDNELDNKLSQYDDERLNQLYMKVFNTADGELVLRGLANRCYVDVPLNTDGWHQDRLIMNEGKRSVYLTIMSRLRNAVTKQGGSDEDS